MSYLKDREIWLSSVPTGNPPAGYVWVFIQNGVFVVRDSSGVDKIMATTTGTVTNATSASYVEYSNVADKPALISGSSQVSYTGLSDIPAGIVSSSVQIGEYGVFATTGSNQFDGSQAVTGSLTVTGQVIAQTLNVQQVTSSIVYSSGSNIFGNDLGNTQQFTGSVSVTGSLTVNGAGTFANNVTTQGGNFRLFNGYYLTAKRADGADINVLGFPAGSNNLTSVTPNDYNLQNTGGTNLFSISSTGIATFTGQTVAANGSVNIESADPAIRFRYTGGTSNSRIYEWRAVAAGGVNDIMQLRLWNDAQSSASTLFTVSPTGAGIFSSTVTATKGFFSSNAAADSSTGLLANASTNDSSTYAAIFGSLNAGYRMVVRADGNVGIGETNPSTKVHINGSSGEDLIRFQAGAVNTKFLFKLTGGANDPFTIRRNHPDGNLDIMSWTYNGNVGVGTEDPQSKFDVTNIIGTAYDASNTLVSGQTMRIANTSGVSGISANLLFIATGAGGGNGLGSISGVNTGTGSLAITFGTRDSGGSVTEKMRITSTGNVGINTTDPSNHKLYVQGNLSMSGSGLMRTYTAQSTTLGAKFDIFRFLNDAGSLIAQGAISGILFINASDTATGGNQISYTFHLQTNGNGTSQANLTQMSFQLRGTQPITSIALENDGGGGGVKVVANVVGSGVSGCIVRATFVGVAI